MIDVDMQVHEGSCETVLSDSSVSDTEEVTGPRRNGKNDLPNQTAFKLPEISAKDLEFACGKTLPALTKDETHEQQDKLIHDSKVILRKAKKILKENPQFALEGRISEWKDEIGHLLQDAVPKTQIGVLGNTGVGKSSLLNALLDEASILPTSGSRGCTAAVVELRYNDRLCQETKGKAVPVYSGVVEFMRLEDWRAELKHLVTEVCTHEKTLYVRPPDPGTAPDTHAAWSKIDQVYGKGTLSRFPPGSDYKTVYEQLAKHPRIVRLLTPGSHVKNRDAESSFNTVVVHEGEVVPGTPEAKALMKGRHALGPRLVRQMNGWGKAFRRRINDYVYRDGNGEKPQTWPLIRKVVLNGPWPALSTGACLVDLPGVRDANAARAKVAEKYLKNCNLVWIVAPIKRAVDDATAKELLGEEFKRRLLMDGQYGNVSFVCTQTDDCETSEIMRDHSDVAQTVPGRMERMNQLRSDITDAQGTLCELEARGMELEDQNASQRSQLRKVKKTLKRVLSRRPREEAAVRIQSWCRSLLARRTEEKQIQEDDICDHETVCHCDSDDDNQSDTVRFMKEGGGEEEEYEYMPSAEFDAWVVERKLEIEHLRQDLNVSTKCLNEWKTDDAPKIPQYKATISHLQKLLKPICARVRNEYSTKQLQDDFRSGLEDLIRGAAPEEQAESTSSSSSSAAPSPSAPNPLPKDFKMDVFCISANDYLKLQGIKSTSDGPPATFTKADQTNIPALNAFVHRTTARIRQNTTLKLVKSVSQFVDRMKLYSSDTNCNISGALCKKMFEEEMSRLEDRFTGPLNAFIKTIGDKVKRVLEPALNKGASDGQKEALNIVDSWGSKSRRSAQNRSPQRNGLYWATYFAVVRRDGVFASKSAGPVNFNEELCSPVENAFSVSWQQTMDAAIATGLALCSKRMIGESITSSKAVIASFRRKGMAKDRLFAIENAAQDAVMTSCQEEFDKIMTFATDRQKDLNRALLPEVQERMMPGYSNARNTQGGAGRFDRIKREVRKHTEQILQSLFKDSTISLLKQIADLVGLIEKQIRLAFQSIKKALESVYAVSWENETNMLSPEVLEAMLACRTKLIPTFTQLRTEMDSIFDAAGIKRDEPELTLTGVRGVDDRLKEAETKGEVMDLCSD